MAGNTCSGERGNGREIETEMIKTNKLEKKKKENNKQCACIIRSTHLFVV